MRTLIKTTQDGRKLEVYGLAILLGGKLEATELLEVRLHPQKNAILAAAPDATHMAGRVTLTRDEAEAVEAALKAAETEVLANPVAISERFRIAMNWKTCTEGIE